MSTPRRKKAPVTAPGQRLVTSTSMLLVAAGRAAQRRLETSLAEHGLTLRHLGALGHLAHTPGLSYSDLARRARITPQSMHATMAQLTDLGAVITTTRGRATYPELTDHGRRLLATAADIAGTLDRDWDIDETSPQLREVLLRIARQTAATEGSTTFL